MGFLPVSDVMWVMNINIVYQHQMVKICPLYLNVLQRNKQLITSVYTILLLAQ